MIFMSLYSGAFVGLVGSIEAAIAIYAINTFLRLCHCSGIYDIREKAEAWFGDMREKWCLS